MVALQPIRRGTDLIAPACQRPSCPPTILGAHEELLLEERRDDELMLERELEEDVALELETAARELLEPVGTSGKALGLLPQLFAGMLRPPAAVPAIVIPIAVNTGPIWFATPRLRVPRSAPHNKPTTLPAVSTITAPESP